MKLWKKTTGAIKDQNTIFIASLSSRRISIHNNIDIQALVIKSTSHNEYKIDYRNSHRIFRLIPQSPAKHLQTFTWALTIRMEKTRDWVVALKGLILMHGVLCCRVPAVHKLGRLPFDLSSFNDGHLSGTKSWPYNTFIRSYFAFLDSKSDLFSSFVREEKKNKDVVSMEPKQHVKAMNLFRLHKLQILLDLLIQIKPESMEIVQILILEAMDSVIIEIFDVYSKICNGIAQLLPTIDVSNRNESLQTLKILRKATQQGDKLSDYFEMCRKIGVMKASEQPVIPIIPIDEIRELERAINEEKAIVKMDENERISESRSRNDFYTIITDEWEVFDENLIGIENGDENQLAIVEPWYDSCGSSCGRKCEELPDLISFL
ncbi:putative clathrin assembly protein At1g25240 [Impatiens glandulifera]|uniref:putative clathrin assembly protein At1g25240 n=1 Tax=Impatiens glandulifera TaxID=253017 RepID=UPI001FB190A4|nr:putative clathrin assembly protein At1g25240 [Impatiens glandulifera]